MPALGRATQRLFGDSASLNQMGVFGSLAAGSPTYIQAPLDSSKIVQMQSLSNFLAAWSSAILGNNSPALQDMNALFAVAFYQLSYILEAGVPEWDAGTTYYRYGIVRGGTSTNGGVFQSLADSNLNNPVTNTTYWKRLDNGGVTVKQYTAGNVNMTESDAGVTFEFNTTTGVASLTLPATIPAGFTFTVKDIGGYFATNPVTIIRSGSENIENLAANFDCQAGYGAWEFFYDGTNIWLR